MEPKRILLAENEPETARFIESKLKNLGLIVDTVADGDSTWNLLQTGQYAILICDENLKGMSDVNLAKRIRYAPKFSELFIISIVSKIPVREMHSCFGLMDGELERDDLSEISKWVQRMLTAVDPSDSRYLL